MNNKRKDEAVKKFDGCYIVRDDSEKYVPRMDPRSSYERFGGDHLVGGGFLAGDRPRIGPEPNYAAEPEAVEGSGIDWIWDGPFGPMDDSGWMWVSVPTFEALAEEQRREANDASSRRYERMLSAAGKATKGQIRARWEYYGDKCYICGTEAEATDHVKPLAKDGSNWPANLRPICKRCNSKKRDKWPYDIEQARRKAGYYD